MSELYIGLMSGTSLDGVDVVVVSINGHSADNNIELVAQHEHPYPQNLRQQVLSICNDQNTSLSSIGKLDHELGKLYAAAVNEILHQTQLPSSQITAIGNHGQTVFHQPTGESPFTMQLGDSHIIAALTGIDTVADFRRMDMAMGGQGAPLTPAFHQYVFAPPHSKISQDSLIAVLNIGGISNVTLISVDKNVTGFDTGPGNLLMDSWCERHTGKPFDNNAEWASAGQVNQALLSQLMSDPFLKTPAPKSTGREHYNLDWLETQLQSQNPLNTINPVDVQRTLCEFTACSIALHLQNLQNLEQNAPGPYPELLVCGGGVNNPLLFERLTALLPNWAIKPTDERGIPANSMEAMAFAWLAHQRIHHLPSNLPAVTGARASVSLGVVISAGTAAVCPIR